MAKDFYGNGWNYPFGFVDTTKCEGLNCNVKQSKYIEHINQSVHQILGTVLGERAVRRDFGSDLTRILFSPNDPSIVSRLQYSIFRALRVYEPRAEVVNIYGNDSEKELGRIDITITLRLRNTNVSWNMVWPFYVQWQDPTTFVT